MKALAEAGYSSFLILNREAANDLLTERRMELIEAIREEEPDTISELAEAVDRKVSAVSRDLDILAKHTVIEFEEGPGGRKKPVLDQEYIFVEPLLEPID